MADPFINNAQPYPYQGDSNQPHSNSNRIYMHPNNQQPMYIAPNQHQVQSYQKPSPSSSGDSSLYLSLVGMSESFLSMSQPRLAIHCLESILTIKSQDMTVATSLHIQLRTRLNLCRLYLDYTSQCNQYINTHVDKSMIIIQNLASNDELKYEATLTLYEIFQRQKEIHQKMKCDSAAAGGQHPIDPNQSNTLFNLDLIRKVLETSKSFPIWHTRLLLLIGV